MLIESLERKISNIVSRFVKQTSLGAYPQSVPLDITKPNIHESKAEFIAEKEAVDTAIGHADKIHRLFYLKIDNEASESERAMGGRLVSYIDDRTKRRAKDSVFKTPADLIEKNASELSTCLMTLILLRNVERELIERKVELADQERDFWSGSSRPPNHYARTIALRLARVVANETGEFPTLGVSREGSHPSTEYGRALEEIFELLEIKANFRRAGKWAIEQLTENDLHKPVAALGGFSNLGLGASTDADIEFDGILGSFFKPKGS